MRVAVVGCGYVGLVTGVGLASLGHEVLGVEADPDRRELIARGEVPFHEPGLPELLRSELDRERFRVSPDIDGVASAEVVLLAVQTPSGPGGAIDLQHLTRAAERVAEAFAQVPTGRRVVAVRSTAVPGTVADLLSPMFGPDTAVASNPEFLREGSAVHEFLTPDRIVIGCDEEWGRELLAGLYQGLDAPIVHASPTEVELAKYASNAFLATLISFSNEIAHICEPLDGVDVEEVLGILHTDRRLSSSEAGETVRPEILSYLKAGCGYGGSCLPKDLAALLAAARAAGLRLPLLEAVEDVNHAQPGRLIASVERELGRMEGRKIALLGVAFKAGTDDVRSSPGMRILEGLVDAGADVAVFDPLVGPDRLRELAVADRVRLADSMLAALDGADACVITTDAPEFQLLPELLSLAANSRMVVVDGRRTLSGNRIGEAVYVGVGRGSHIKQKLMGLGAAASQLDLLQVAFVPPV